MSLIALSDRLNRAPLLKVLVPFAAGIALSQYYTLPLWFLTGAFVCSGAMALLLRSQLCTLFLLLTAGFAAAQLHTRERTVPLEVATVFEIRVEGIPADRGRYSTAEGVVTAWRDPADGQWHAAGDKAILYADSLTTLFSGERIYTQGRIRPFRGGSESYRHLMERRGFAGTLNLSQRSILERSAPEAGSLHARASERLQRLGIEGDAGAVLRAMTAGDRSEVTASLRAAYSHSGFSHLLAVSGLHTGIVFGLVNLILWWLPLIRRGHLLKNFAAALCIWLFVAAAGFPPSAVRAAVMCTFLQFSLASASEYSTLNSLCTAALGMLMWNPAWLGDISFQLSVLAVAGILVWGVPLCRRLRSPWRVLNTITDALAVSLAASLATLPLVSHTFGIIPLAGILLNPVAILLATVVVFAGAVWLVMPLGLLAPVFKFTAGPAAEALNALTRFTARIPSGSLDFTLGAGATAAVYLFFAAATLAAWSIEPKKSVHLPV